MAINSILYNFSINQGADETIQLTIVDAITNLPINITGYTFKSEIRYAFTDASPVASWTCTITDGANGILKLYLSNTATTSLVPGNYVCDVKMTDTSSYVSRIVEGPLTVYAEVTR